MPQRALSAELYIQSRCHSLTVAPAGVPLFLRTTEMLAGVIHGLRLSLNIDGNTNIYLGTESCFS